MNYGRVLKKYRELTGITQEQIAAGLGRQQAFVSKIENGHRSIDLVTFIDWVQLMSNKEQLLKEIGLLERQPKEDYKGIFFELIKNEMLQQQL